MVGIVRIELTTPCVSSKCSTNELDALKNKQWWAMRDSNSRPSRCKRDALPTELIALGLILLCIATKIESENENCF